MAPSNPVAATAIILAAGEGTRMRSAVPKVLQDLDERMQAEEVARREGAG